MTVEEIIAGCRKGENNARRELYERYAAQMYGVVSRYIKDRATAEDLLHDGFVTIFTKIGDFRGEGAFEGWCRRIFVNTALGFIRKKSPELVEDPAESTLALKQINPNAIDRLSAEDLKRCIDSLPRGYKTILNLYAVDGYTHREIAEQLGITENTSRSQYIRAKMKLAEILEDRMEYEKRRI